jgi:hypothetical protein
MANLELASPVLGGVSEALAIVYLFFDPWHDRAVWQYADLRIAFGLEKVLKPVYNRGAGLPRRVCLDRTFLDQTKRVSRTAQSPVSELSVVCEVIAVMPPGIKEVFQFLDSQSRIVRRYICSVFGGSMQYVMETLGRF